MSITVLSSSVCSPDNFNSTYETTPDIVIITVNHGSGATAIAQLSSEGEVSRIELTNAGLGYTQAPTVLITGGGGYGAVAEATLNGDGSINVNVLEGGSGYTSDPATIRFLEKHARKHKDAGIFRKTWITWKKAYEKIGQRKLV